MRRFLLDANLSKRTAEYLHDHFGFDAATVPDLIRADSIDEQVTALAIREQRILITFDVGFGRLYFRFAQGQCGMIVLRLADQTVPSVNATLEWLFSDRDYSSIEFDRCLVMTDGKRVRVTASPS